MAETCKKNWLSHQIASAKRGLKEHPEWLQKASYFAGSDHRMHVARSNGTSGESKNAIR